MSALLEYDDGAYALSAEFTKRPPLGGPAFKSLDALLAQLRNEVGAVEVSLVRRQDLDYDYTCRLRDRRDWIQRLHLDGRVDFSGISDSWAKHEAEMQLKVGGELLFLTQQHGLFALSAAWSDPPPRDGEEAIEAEIVP